MIFSQLRRRAVPAALAAIVLVSVAGCGGGGGESDTGARKRATAFTVEHRFGTTKLDTVPKRIVTIDLPWTDVMLAMGVEPVGYSVDALMPKSGVPWQRLPAKATALQLGDKLPIEEIAKLDPDLIVGIYSIADKDTYSLLAEIAPTIAALDEQQVTPWQQLVTMAGEILEETDKASQVVTSVEDKVLAAAKEFPGLRGRTFALAQYIVGDSMYIVADEKDGSSVFFQQLGMKLFPAVVAEGRKTGDVRVNVSTERVDLLRADLLAFLINGGDSGDLADIPGFDKLPGTVALLDYPTIVGLNTPSPLSIPYSLDKLRPHLEKAAEAKP